MSMLTLISAALVLLDIVPSGDAAHSRARTRYVVSRENDQDRDTASFTNEGRLLQVEYGMEAAQRASTAAVINMEHGGDDGEGDNAILVVVNKWNKMYKLDDHVWMVVTGLFGDALFMANNLRGFCQSFRKEHGEAPTIRDVAQQASRIQHLLTMQDTLRPLGITAIVMGIDPHDVSKQRIFRTGPGGVLQECRYCVGGRFQEQVAKEVAKELGKINDDKDRDQGFRSLSEMLKATINSLGELAGQETVDVWTLRPDGKGNLLAKCFLKVDKQNYDNVASS